MNSTVSTHDVAPTHRNATRARPAAWLGVEPHRRFLEPMEAQLDRMLANPEVVSSLVARGVADDEVSSRVRRDLVNMAQGLTVLADVDAQALLGQILPDHVYRAVSSFELRLDHVGREVACPIDSLLDTLHSAAAATDELEHLPQDAPSANSRGDLVFPSVQVVRALSKDDPTVEDVTIARSFLRPGLESAALPVSLELFYVGRRDGTGAQHLDHMEQRLRALVAEPSRLAEPPTPICHISVEVADLAALELIHAMGAEDRSGLVTPYGKEISVNAGDGSHNTKLAVRLEPRPQSAVNVLEFVYFA